MKNIALTLGAAVVALSAVSTTDAEAGGKKFHHGWHKPHWNIYYGSPYWYGYPKYDCFWKKRKVWTPHGWHWKKVKICKPFYPF